MIFVSLNNLYNTIRNSSWMVSRLNPTGILGVPRSGMMCAVILSEETHIGCCSVNEFLDNDGNNDIFKRHGTRFVRHDNDEKELYIVLEDSVYNGSIVKYMTLLRSRFPNKTFISCAVYLEGPCKIYKPDMYFLDIREAVKNGNDIPIALYEYNLLDNHVSHMYLFDIDGVVCKNPPADTDTEAYEKYLDNPIPLHIPVNSTNGLNFCTYRLKKYEQKTRKFLEDNGINIKHLYMFNADTREERNLTDPAEYKADIYKSSNEFILFIESDNNEAARIRELSGKPVYCFETGILYR